jgi:Asp-tRNA(Asn)/Glu-tRNA(Gln) amidotransferase A subunit family amidase
MTHISLKAYFARIDEVNLQGPVLRAVLEINPSALEQAAVLDAERKVHGPRGPLHGIPILLKDNIATRISDGECLISVHFVYFLNLHAAGLRHEYHGW